MTTTENYLDHAAECELRAGKVSSPDARQAFLILAETWRRLADPNHRDLSREIPANSGDISLKF